MRAFAVIVAVAACGRPAPVAAPPPVETLRGPPLPSRVVVADDLDWDLVVAGNTVVWIVDGVQLRAVPSEGGDVTDLAQLPIEAGCVVVETGDSLLVLAAGLWRVPLDGGDAVLLVPRVDAAVAALVGDALVIADDGVIWHQPLDGGEPRTLTTDAGAIEAIAVVGDQVYWVDNGVRLRRGVQPCPATSGPGSPAPSSRAGCSMIAPRDGALWRVGLDGAGRELLASGLRSPRGLGVHAGSLWFGDDDAIIARVPLDGGDREVVVPGDGGWLVADDRGVVAITAHGEIVEHVDGTTHVRSLARRDIQTLALTGDQIFAVRDDADAVVAFPRAPSRVTLVEPPGAGIPIYFDDHAFPLLPSVEHGHLVFGDGVVFVEAIEQEMWLRLAMEPRTMEAP